MSKPLPLLERAPDRWRDRILTGVTILMALDLFIVAPTDALVSYDLRPFSIAIVIALSAALIVLSRSVLPMIGIAVASGVFGTALALRIKGDHVTLDACLEATAWLISSLIIFWAVARAVFAPGRITYHRIVGAVLLYLTIGLTFVALFTLVGALSPGAFSGLAITDRVTLPSDLIYFSFSTLTSVGYGDITPVHPLARSLANIESVVGQLYPATLVARLVSLEIGSGAR